MGAEAGHEAERVGDALLLQIADRRLVDRVAGVAEGKNQPNRLIVVGLCADEDRKLLGRASLEVGAGHEVVNRQETRPLDCRVYEQHEVCEFRRRDTPGQRRPEWSDCARAE